MGQVVLGGLWNAVICGKDVVKGFQHQTFWTALPIGLWYSGLAHVPVLWFQKRENFGSGDILNLFTYLAAPGLC